MWLPTPIYERIPQFWLLLGLLFMTSGTYLGFDFSLSFFYFGVGLFCVIWSISKFVMRSHNRCDPVRTPMTFIAEEKPAAADEQVADESAEQASAQPG
jgi:hypothetical protein